jgi:hypothetical protein
MGLPVDSDALEESSLDPLVLGSASESELLLDVDDAELDDAALDDAELELGVVLPSEDEPSDPGSSLGHPHSATQTHARRSMFMLPRPRHPPPVS